MPIVIIGLIIGMAFAVKSCKSHQDNEEMYKKNMIALNDTIRTYKSKKGSTVSTTAIFSVKDYNDLKALNAKLYEQLKDLKQKKLTSGAVFSGEISAPKTDTVFIATEEEKQLSRMTRDFSFVDQYRELSGNIYWFNDTLGMNVQKDMFFFDYTVAIDDKSNIYIKSDNPYVRINEIKGFSVPQTANKKHWGIGPCIGYSYDPLHNRFTPTFTFGIHYNLIQF